MCCENCDDPNAVDFYCVDTYCECHRCAECETALRLEPKPYCGGDKCLYGEGQPVCDGGCADGSDGGNTGYDPNCSLHGGGPVSTIEEVGGGRKT